MTMVVEKTSYPPASPLYEESLSSSLESLELRAKPKMSNESDESGITAATTTTTSPSISSSNSGSGSNYAIAKPLPRSVAAIAARHKFEKV